MLPSALPLSAEEFATITIPVERSSCGNGLTSNACSIFSNLPKHACHSCSTTQLPNPSPTPPETTYKVPRLLELPISHSPPLPVPPLPICNLHHFPMMKNQLQSPLIHYCNVKVLHTLSCHPLELWRLQSIFGLSGFQKIMWLQRTSALRLTPHI